MSLKSCVNYAALTLLNTGATRSLSHFARLSIPTAAESNLQIFWWKPSGRVVILSRLSARN